MWRYTRLLRPACLFTLHVGSAPYPLSSGAFLTTATFTNFPTPRLLGRSRHSYLLWPACLFRVLCGIAPLPYFGAQGAPPSLLCVWGFFLLLFIQFGFSLFFSLGGSQSVQGAMLIWPRVVCGSITCHLARLVACFFPASRSWCLAAQEPSWFLCLLWSGDATRGLGVWKCRSFASSWWFFLQDVSPASLQDFT
jgi:hypothetical protein